MDKIRDCGAEKHYYRKRAVRITAIVLASVLCILFSGAFIADFNTENALFKNGSVIAGFAYYGSFASALVIIVLTFILIPKEKAEEGTFPAENDFHRYYEVENQLMKVFRLAIAVIVAVQGLVRAVCDGLDGKGFFSAVGILILSIAFALYFVPEIAEKITDLGGRLHLVFGVLGMLWLLVNTFVAYFNRALPLSSEYTVLSEVGYILLLLAMTYEIRFRLDGSCVRARLATACAAFVFGTGFGVGRSIMIMTVGQVSYTDTALAYTTLALSVYFGVRVLFYSED